MVICTPDFFKKVENETKQNGNTEGGADPMAEWLNSYAALWCPRVWPVLVVGVDLQTTHHAMLWWHPTQKNQSDLQLGYTTTYWGFGEKKKEEDWQKMLARGQSSSLRKHKKKERNTEGNLQFENRFWLLILPHVRVCSLYF